MKKFVTIALVLILAFASVAALAEIETRKIPVTLTLEEGYEWKIPESITLYEFPTAELKNEFDIEVTKWRVAGNKGLAVYCTAEVSLKLDEDNKVYVNITSGYDRKGSSNIYFDFEGIGKRTAVFTLPDTSAKPAGSYSGELTINAELLDK